MNITKDILIDQSAVLPHDLYIHLFNIMTEIHSHKNITEQMRSDNT